MKNVFKTSFVYFPVLLAALLGLVHWLILDREESPIYLMAWSLPLALIVALFQVFPWVWLGNFVQRHSRIVRNRLILLPLFIVNLLLPHLGIMIINWTIKPYYQAMMEFAFRDKWTSVIGSEKAQTTWFICLFIALAVVAVAYRVQKKAQDAEEAAHAAAGS